MSISTILTLALTRVNPDEVLSNCSFLPHWGYSFNKLFSDCYIYKHTYEGCPSKSCTFFITQDYANGII